MLAAEGIVAFVVLTMFGCCMAARLFAPVNTMCAWVGAWNKGDVKAEPHVPASDCRGRLARALRDMVDANRREKDWLLSTLKSIPSGISVTDMDMKWPWPRRWSSKSTVPMNTHGDTPASRPYRL